MVIRYWAFAGIAGRVIIQKTSTSIIFVTREDMVHRSMVRTRDIDLFREHIGSNCRNAMDVDCLRAEGNGGEYRHGRITFERCRLDDVTASGDFRVAIRRVAPVMVWWIADGRVEVTCNGATHVANAGDVFLLATGPSPLLVRLVDATLKTLSIDFADVERQGRRSENGDIRFTGARPISPVMARAWKSTVTYAHETVLAEPEVAIPSMVDGVARLLVEATLATFPHICESRAEVEEPPRPMPALLRRTVEFIEENASRDIGVLDVATAVSLTPRRVQTVFKQYLDTTPTAYLRLTRLRRAREELLVADPATTTVTATAGRWGFGHTGRFAVVYRQAFGESPHETLRR